MENTLSCCSPIKVSAATESDAQIVALNSKTFRGLSCKVSLGVSFCRLNLMIKSAAHPYEYLFRWWLGSVRASPKSIGLFLALHTGRCRRSIQKTCASWGCNQPQRWLAAAAHRRTRFRWSLACWVGQCRWSRQGGQLTILRWCRFPIHVGSVSEWHWQYFEALDEPTHEDIHEDEHDNKEQDDLECLQHVRDLW